MSEPENITENDSWQDSDAMIKILLRNTEESFVMVGLDYKIICFNTQFGERFNQYFKKIPKTGESIIDYTLPHRQENLKKIYASVFTGREIKNEMAIPGPEGKMMHFINIFKPAYSENKEIIGAFVSSFNITDQRNAEQNLSSSEKKYNILLDHISDLYIILNLDLKPVYISKTQEQTEIKLSGYQNASDWTECIHPDDREKINSLISRALQNPGIPYKGTGSRLLTVSGHYTWVQAQITNWIEDPDIGGIIIMLKNVDEYKYTEQELFLHRDRLQQIMDNSPDLICTFDTQANFLSASHSVYNILGYRPDELVQVNISSLLTNTYEYELEETIQQILHSQTPLQFTGSCERKDGKQVMLEWTINFDPEKNIAYGVGRDITQKYYWAELQNLTSEVNQFIHSGQPLKSVLRDIIEKISILFTLPYAEVWISDKKENFLKPLCVYPDITEDAYSEKIKFQPGQGMPGITWINQTIETWNNLDEYPDYSRKKQAKVNGLKHAFSVPILFNGNVLAVFIFFSRKTINLNDNQLILLNQISIHIGRELQRRKEKEDLDILFNNTPSINCIVGTDGYFKKINPAFSQLLEYTQEEILEHPYNHFVHPEDREKSQNQLEENLRGSTISEFVNRYISKSGKILWISWKTSKLFEEDQIIFGFGNDITKEKETESALKNLTLELEAKVEARTAELTTAHKILSRNLHQMQDSIRYAKRIQDAVLPGEKRFHEIFPEAFVFNEPKDLVSGDFLWFHHTNTYDMLAIVDCTGHGVPGALMSMVANQLLNQIVLRNGIDQPDLIMIALHHELIRLFQEDIRTVPHEGMDILFCKFDHTHKVIEVSGAQRPLFIFDGKKLTEFVMDKTTIGNAQLYPDNMMFTKKALRMKKGHILYFSTDGYYSQFGGDQHKKMMKKNFISFLRNISHLPMQEQGDKIREYFHTWKGDHKQIDDVLVAGIQIQ